MNKSHCLSCDIYHIYNLYLRLRLASLYTTLLNPDYVNSVFLEADFYSSPLNTFSTCLNLLCDAQWHGATHRVIPW